MKTELKQTDIFDRGFYMVDKTAVRYNITDDEFYLEGTANRLGYLTVMQRSRALACAIPDWKASPVKWHKKRVEPIKLTPEILEKNGWMHDIVLHNWWHEGVEFVVLYDSVTMNNYYCHALTSVELIYVHQLQRILICCGLEELAYNFKI